MQFVFKAFEGATNLGARVFSILSRVYDFLVKLDKLTNGWSTRILAFLAIWKAFNLSFLLTPLGLLIAALTTILLLFDDFETYQEGGKSLINWGKYLPTINAVKDAILDVYNIFKALFSGDTKEFDKAFSKLSEMVIPAIKGLFSLMRAQWKLEWDLLTSDFAETIFESILNAFKISAARLSLAGNLFQIGEVAWRKFFTYPGSGNLGANISAAPAGIPAGTGPLSNTAYNNQTNQNLQAETNIFVTSTADANALAQALISGQGRVNADMARNFQNNVKR